MIRINLIPVPKARKQEALIFQAVAAVLILIGVSVACYFVTVGKQAKVVAIQNDISKKQREIDELKAKVGEVEKYKQQAQSLEQQLGVIRNLEKGRSGPVKLMDELTEMAPRKLWLTTFKEANKSVTVEGMAESGPVIADFLDSLKAAKYFTNVHLSSVSAVELSGAKVHKFIISISVKYDI